MQRVGGQMVYSATDLVGFMECRHLTNLERAAAARLVTRPVRVDPVLDRIGQRGRDHEARFLDDRRAEGLSIADLSSESPDDPLTRYTRGCEATLAAMRSGVDLTLKQLAAAFEKFHLKEVNPVGEKFDPHQHQAISTVEADQEPNTVVQVFQKGYLLNERVMRPAMVSVAKAKSA